MWKRLLSQDSVRIGSRRCDDDEVISRSCVHKPTDHVQAFEVLD